MKWFSPKCTQNSHHKDSAVFIYVLPSALWHCWLDGRKGIRPVKSWVVCTGMATCLERGANLHMVQLMPLPLAVSCSSKSRLVLPFCYRVTQVVPYKRPLNRCCCCCWILLMVTVSVVHIVSISNMTPINELINRAIQTYSSFQFYLIFLSQSSITLQSNCAILQYVMSFRFQAHLLSWLRPVLNF